MAIPNSASIIKASRDSDLIERAVAIGAAMGLTRADVEANRTRFASLSVNEDGDTIASVYEYADAHYEPVPRPGEDPAAVTDGHIVHALKRLTTNEGAGS